ncbi:MAG: hypothetical protein WDW38_010063 [Sanguina aurantia]
MKFWACLIGYQLVWFCAVIGAEHGLAWPGVAGMLVYALLQLALLRNYRTDLSLMAAALVFGSLVDGGLAYTGLARYGAAWPSAAFAPVWILALWMTFSMTFTVSLVYLQKRLWVAILFGALGGPIAYMSASRGFHVVTFTAPAWRGLVFLGVGWAVATPLLALIARRSVPADATHETVALHGQPS